MIEWNDLFVIITGKFYQNEIPLERISILIRRDQFLPKILLQTIFEFIHNCMSLNVLKLCFE